MTMALRMILLVCLGNIYPGARSQLGGSGKWVITVSGCSPLPPPVLVCCAANTYSSVAKKSISSVLVQYFQCCKYCYSTVYIGLLWEE